MIIFDSGPLFAFSNKDHPKHDIAVTVVNNSLKGKYGRPVISNYIIDEVLTLARAQTKSCECGENILKLVKSQKEGKHVFFEIIIQTEVIVRTEEYYSKYCRKGLSFTDCSLLALMEMFNISYLATFAKEFTGLATIVP